MGKKFDALPSKYQRFVSSYINDGRLTIAAKKAGSQAKNLSQAGKELLIREDIQAAIMEVNQELAADHNVTRESLAKEFNLAYKVALGAQNPSAMVAAASGKARLYGLDIQKTVSDQPEQESDQLDPLLKSVIDYGKPKIASK